MFSSIFGSGFPWRAAALLVTAAFACLLADSAGAQTALDETYAQPINSTRCTDSARCPRPEAYSLINGWSGWCPSHFPGSTTELIAGVWENVSSKKYYVKTVCRKTGTSYNITTFYAAWTGDCPAGQEFNSLRGICQSSCSSRPQKIVDYKQMIPNGSYACIDGCEARIAPAPDGGYFQTFVGGATSHCAVLPSDCSKFGAGYGMNFGTSMCQPPFEECSSNQVKDPISGICKDGCEPGKVMDANGVCKGEINECPPGNIKSPAGGCLPGDGQCAAGEVRGKDGTCKRDADGDGKPDSGEDEGSTDETFSGGDNCNSPPACSGSPILCGQARIQWRIDCNTRRNRNISGGACNAMPVCTGDKCDAMEYSSLLMQWRTACAMEKLAGKGDGGDDGQPAWTRVDGMNQNPGAGAQPGDTPKLHERSFSTDDLDQSGFGGGSCIGFAAGGGAGLSSGLLNVLASPPPFWCNFISLLRAAIILGGAVASCFIIARSA